MSAPALKLLPGGEIPPGSPSYAELLARLQEAEERNVGLEVTLRSQAATIGRLRGKLEAQDPESHPRHREMSALIDRWRTATGHKRSRMSKDRFDLIRARLSDGYEPEEIALAIDGLAAFPFVVNAKRSRTGQPSQRYDQLEHALKSGSKVEQFANLGYRARKEAS